MHHIFIKIITVLLSYFITITVYASLINFDLLTPNITPLVSYDNQYHDEFSSSADGFQIYQRDIDSNIPAALLDNSNIASSDSLGIISSMNRQKFFGIVDTQNLDNPSGLAVARWQINIKSMTRLALAIDMAAMGNFESNDQFLWQYSIDSLPLTTIFNGISNENTSQNYTLENSSSQSLDDPLSVNSRLLSNEFQHFSSTIPGIGDMLTIELRVQTNGGSEAIAFQNVNFQAKINNIVVSEPNSLSILFLALGLFFVKCRN